MRQHHNVIQCGSSHSPNKHQSVKSLLVCQCVYYRTTLYDANRNTFETQHKTIGNPFDTRPILLHPYPVWRMSDGRHSIQLEMDYSRLWLSWLYGSCCGWGMCGSVIKSTPIGQPGGWRLLATATTRGRLLVGLIGVLFQIDSLSPLSSHSSTSVSFGQFLR